MSTARQESFQRYRWTIWWWKCRKNSSEAACRSRPVFLVLLGPDGDPLRGYGTVRFPLRRDNVPFSLSLLVFRPQRTYRVSTLDQPCQPSPHSITPCSVPGEISPRSGRWAVVPSPWPARISPFELLGTMPSFIACR